MKPARIQRLLVKMKPGEVVTREIEKVERSRTTVVFGSGLVDYEIKGWIKGSMDSAGEHVSLDLDPLAFAVGSKAKEIWDRESLLPVTVYLMEYKEQEA